MKIFLISLVLLFSCGYALAQPPCNFEQLKASEAGDASCDVVDALPDVRLQYNEYRLTNFAAMSVDAFSSFLAELQDATKRDDKKRLESLIHWPLRYSLHGKSVLAKNPAQFEKNYSNVFYPQIKEVVAKASLSNVMLVSAEGVSLDGVGSVWIAAYQKKNKSDHTNIKIRTIN